MFERLLFAVLVVALFGCQSTQTGEPFVDDPNHQIQKTLDKASIRVSAALAREIGFTTFKNIPSREGSSSQSRQKFDQLAKHLSGKKVPVLLYMHGCGGLSPDDEYSFDPLLNKSNVKFVLVGPSSFARPRPVACKDASKSFSSFWRRSYDFRLAELEYALGVLSAENWVGQVFLMGHSQGASTVAEYSGDIPVEGRILHAGMCGALSGTWGNGNGIRAGEKIIALHSYNDPWPGIGRHSKCVQIAQKNGGKAVTTSLKVHNLVPMPDFYNPLILWMRENFKGS